MRPSLTFRFLVLIHKPEETPGEHVTEGTGRWTRYRKGKGCGGKIALTYGRCKLGHGSPPYNKEGVSYCRLAFIYHTLTAGTQAVSTGGTVMLEILIPCQHKVTSLSDPVLKLPLGWVFHPVLLNMNQPWSREAKQALLPDPLWQVPQPGPLPPQALLDEGFPKDSSLKKQLAGLAGRHLTSHMRCPVQKGEYPQSYRARFSFTYCWCYPSVPLLSMPQLREEELIRNRVEQEVVKNLALLCRAASCNRSTSDQSYDQSTWLLSTAAMRNPLPSMHLYTHTHVHTHHSYCMAVTGSILDLLSFLCWTAFHHLRIPARWIRDCAAVCPWCSQASLSLPLLTLAFYEVCE